MLHKLFKFLANFGQPTWTMMTVMHGSLDRLDVDPHTALAEEAAAPAPDVAQAASVPGGTGRRLLRITIAVAVGLGAGFLLVSYDKMAANAKLADMTRASLSEPPPVDAALVKQSSATQTLSLPGATAAWDDASIYSRVNGYVAKWFVDIGDHVKVGQTLATINTPELDAELVAAEAKLHVSIAQVSVKQAQADFARTSDERWRDSPKGVVSDQERADKQAARVEADAELAAAHAQVALEQADVDRLTALTQFKQVKAPFDGVVVERQIDTGNLVTAGSTANTVALYRIAQDDPIRVFVNAPQSVAVQLMKPGVEADVSLGDGAHSRIEGKVTRTARTIDPRSRTLRVEIDIPNANHALVPGMYVQVAFRLKTGDGFQIPAAALLFRSNGPQVAVVDKKGAIAFRNVTIASDDGSVVTVGSGLSEGDRVALNLSSQIGPGQIVKLKSADAGAIESTTRVQ